MNSLNRNALNVQNFPVVRVEGQTTQFSDLGKPSCGQGPALPLDFTLEVEFVSLEAEVPLLLFAELWTSGEENLPWKCMCRCCL